MAGQRSGAHARIDASSVLHPELIDLLRQLVAGRLKLGVFVQAMQTHVRPPVVIQKL
jgi:hypothetical protein